MNKAHHENNRVHVRDTSRIFFGALNAPYNLFFGTAQLR